MLTLRKLTGAVGKASRKQQPETVDTGWNEDTSPVPVYAGVYLPDRKHLGIGVGDMALVQPTGDPVNSVLTRGHDGVAGVFVPQGAYGNIPVTGRAPTDGNWYSKTLNPVAPAHVIATQELVYTDLAGNAGPLQGSFDLTPLIDIQALNAKGAKSF